MSTVVLPDSALSAPEAELPGRRIVEALRVRAEALGFESFGIARADSRPDLPEKLRQALANGWHGDMDWMAETEERRGSPQKLWSEARSVIMLGMNYGPDRDPLATLAMRDRATLSVYARNRDYHEILKGRLKDLAGLLARRSGAAVKVFVDTAPLMEKPLAEAAGIGWQGKHTVLVSQEFGSWLFLGAILTSAELPSTSPARPSCGSCTRCLDVCPTAAFPAPFQLDARRCLAYLSVEHRGPIPQQFRAPMGNRIYGCDDCLAICPWNKFAKTARELRLAGRSELNAPSLAELVQLDEAAFRNLFSGSPVKRIGHERFLRNVLIAIGNSASPDLLPLAQARLLHPAPLVRGAAVWAVRRLADPAHLITVKASHLAWESDSEVRAEWTAPLFGALGTAA